MKQIASYLKHKLWVDPNAGDKHAVILGLLGGVGLCFIMPDNPSMWWGIIPACVLGLVFLFTLFLMWVEWYHDKLLDEYGDLHSIGAEMWGYRNNDDPDWVKEFQELEDDLNKLERKMYYMGILRRI